MPSTSADEQASDERKRPHENTNPDPADPDRPGDAVRGRARHRARHPHAHTRRTVRGHEPRHCHGQPPAVRRRTDRRGLVRDQRGTIAHLARRRHRQRNPVHARPSGRIRQTTAVRGRQTRHRPAHRHAPLPRDRHRRHRARRARPATNSPASATTPKATAPTGGAPRTASTSCSRRPAIATPTAGSDRPTWHGCPRPPPHQPNARPD